jgi:hypothetical protein
MSFKNFMTMDCGMREWRTDSPEMDSRRMAMGLGAKVERRDVLEIEIEKYQVQESSI